MVPFYDRGSLVGVTTHTVLHNLIFGCVLVFLIQWIFLGDLRSAIIVGVNIPFALFFAIMLLVIHRRKREPAFGRRGGFRDHRRFGCHPCRKHLPKFPKDSGRKTRPTCNVWRTASMGQTRRRRSHSSPAQQMDRSSAAHFDQRAAGGQARFSSRRSLPWPVSCRSSRCRESRGKSLARWRSTYGYALAGALIATFTVTPVLASFVLPEHVKESETIRRAPLAPSLQSRASVSRSPHRVITVAFGLALSRRGCVLRRRARKRVSAALGRGQFLDSRLDADDASRSKTGKRRRGKCG